MCIQKISSSTKAKTLLFTVYIISNNLHAYTSAQNASVYFCMEEVDPKNGARKCFIPA